MISWRPTWVSSAYLLCYTLSKVPDTPPAELTRASKIVVPLPRTQQPKATVKKTTALANLASDWERAKGSAKPPPPKVEPNKPRVIKVELAPNDADEDEDWKTALDNWTRLTEELSHSE